MGFNLVGNAMSGSDFSSWWKSVLFPDYIYHGADGSKGFVDSTGDVLPPDGAEEHTVTGEVIESP